VSWKRRPPVKVEVEGYEPVYVRVLTRRECGIVLSEKLQGERFALALVAMALCDERGEAAYTDLDAGMEDVEGMEQPLFVAVAEAAKAATYPKKPDEGKAEAIPAGG
jgi:hypothetical protein